VKVENERVILIAYSIWNNISGPDSYRPERAENALSRILNAASSGRDPGAEARWAFGSDHRATLYPAAVSDKKTRYIAENYPGGLEVHRCLFWQDGGGCASLSLIMNHLGMLTE
jgi:hypothetical protein